MTREAQAAQDLAITSTDRLSQGHANVKLRITVNGETREAEIDPRIPLVQLLRDEFGLTGTKIGCLTGHCGACSVLLNGEVVKSCTVLAASASGDTVVTIEGLAANRELHPMLRAFWEEYGFQCGYCTPGMILTAMAVLKEYPNPTEAEVRSGLSGNLCRCTGYNNIVKAVQAGAANQK